MTGLLKSCLPFLQPVCLVTQKWNLPFWLADRPGRRKEVRMKGEG